MKGLRLGLSLSGSSAVPFNIDTLFATGSGAYYDPNDLTTMYQTGTRAAPGAAAVVGQPVGLLLDKSGNNNDATQPTASARPILRQTGAYYHLEFDRVDDHLILPTSLLTGWTSGTGMFGAKAIIDTSGVFDNGPVLGDFGSLDDQDFYPYSSGIIFSSFLSTTRPNHGEPGVMNAWHVGDFRSAASDKKAATNGVNYYTNATNVVGVGTDPLIGKSSLGASFNYYGGDIGRIIIKNSVLTGSDYSGAVTWVAAGHGQTL